MLRVVSAWQFAPKRYATARVWETYAFAPCAKHFVTNARPYIIYRFLNVKSGLCLSAPSYAAQATAHHRDSCEKLGAWRNTRLAPPNHGSLSMCAVKLTYYQPEAEAGNDPRAPVETSSASALSSGVIGIVDSHASESVIL